MNTLLTTATPGGRSAAPRASDTGRSHSAAPFASALDGALSENRASDRGVERRGMRDDRATEHGAAKDQRVEDRSRAAAERAADRTAPDAAPDDAPTLQPTADAEEAVPDAPAPERRDTDKAGQSAEPPRGGLPALWALMMGASLGGARPEDAPATDPQAAVPAVPPVDAAADALPMIATGGSVSTDPAVDGAATAAAGPIGASLTEAALPTVVASAPGRSPTAATAGTGSGPLATVSAAIAAAGAVVTDRIAPAAPPAPLEAPVPAPTAPAAPAVPPGALPPDAPGSPDRAASPTATATSGGPLAVPVPQPTGADVALADLGGSPELAVASLGTTSGEAVPTDTDGTGQNPQGSAPATTGPTSVGTAGPAPGTTAVPDVDGARGADPAPPVGIQVARQVAVLRGGPDGAHSMTLVLTPETLGPVEVQVIVTKGSVELALRGASEQGRAALLDGLPDLRRDLEAAGLSCTRVEVDRETGGSWLDRQPAQQQTSGERSGPHDRGDDRSRPGGRTADSGGSGTSAPQNRFTSSSLDVLA